MPRRRRHSSSPSDLMMADDDDDLLNQDDFSPQGSDKCPPQQRNAANARERARMRVLSKAFCRLKTTLPWVPADTKLSKLDTLRLASGYIAHLRALLADQPSDDAQHSGRPLNLSWPFTFQQGIATPWISSAISPERITPPMSSSHTSLRMTEHHQNSLHNHHSVQNHNNNNHNNYINNNNNNHSLNNENNNCDSGYHAGYFNRNGYYPQNEGSGSINNSNNYYSQIQRDSYMRHSYSESMLHTG